MHPSGRFAHLLTSEDCMLYFETPLSKPNVIIHHLMAR